jgi:hypothetical protein
MLSEVFNQSSYEDKINSDVIHQLYFDIELKVQENIKQNIAFDDIIMFPDFYIKQSGESTLTKNNKKILKNLINETNFYIVLHLSHKDHQLKIIEEISNSNIEKKKLLSSSHGTNIYDDGLLYDLPKVSSQQEWETLFGKILSKFHDETLEEAIKKSIDCSENNYAILDNYIAELKKKLQ